MKHILPLSLLLMLFSANLAANAATSGSTVNAASCNQSDVQSALNSVTASTTVVNIPAGTCDWSGNLTWTVPSGVTNLTIQGQTAVNCTGTPGTASYACTAADNTVIRDSWSGSSTSPLVIQMGSGNPTFRMTGMTIEGNTGSVKNDGIIVFYGKSDAFRLDHNHFNVGAYTNHFGTFTGRLYGELEGVLDHNIYDNGGSNTVAQGFAISNTIGDSIGYGDGTWSAPTNFGSSAFIFIEDSIMNGGELEDCDTAGRFVARYNTILNGSTGSAAIHVHGTKTQAGRGRSCRAYEAYHNYVVGPSSPDYALVGSAGGPSLVWGNTLASGYNFLTAVGASRNDGSETETNTPNGWGYCGTAVNGNGVGSGWDGNSSSTTGYPCLDGIGRGQGKSLNGQNFSNALNSLTSSIAWPQQYLEPVYYFANSLPSGIPVADLRDQSTQFNRDIYVDNPSFNGTTGTGSGLLSARPTSCTPGPGGTWGTSPTGSYGVAYFATDTQTLSVCTAADTWTDIYKPYAYPHPLVSGATTASTPPPPPSNLTGTVVN